MKRSLLCGLAVLVMSSNLLVSIERADAAPAPTPSSSRAPTATREARTPSPDQSPECAKNLPDRRGNWACPAKPSEANRSTASTLSPNTYCEAVSACWEKFEPTRVEFRGEIAYGYNDQALGTLRILTRDTLNGYQVINSQFQVAPSRRIVNASQEVEIMDVPYNAPGGTPMGDIGEFYDYCPPRQVDGGTTLFWCDSGLKAYVPDRWYVTVRHFVTWEDPDPNIQGFWWWTVKSIKTRPQGDNWWFGNEDELPWGASEHGWTPYG